MHNKKSCLVKNSSTSKWKCFTHTLATQNKGLIALAQILEKFYHLHCFQAQKMDFWSLYTRFFWGLPEATPYLWSQINVLGPLAKNPWQRNYFVLYCTNPINSSVTHHRGSEIDEILRVTGHRAGQQNHQVRAKLGLEIDFFPPEV